MKLTETEQIDAALSESVSHNISIASIKRSLKSKRDLVGKNNAVSTSVVFDHQRELVENHIAEGYFFHELSDKNLKSLGQEYINSVLISPENGCSACDATGIHNLDDWFFDDIGYKLHSCGLKPECSIRYNESKEIYEILLPIGYVKNTKKYITALAKARNYNLNDCFLKLELDRGGEIVKFSCQLWNFFKKIF